MGLLSTFRRVLTALWRRPGYALVTSLLLGASSAALLVMLAVLDGLLIRAPSGQHIEQLVFIWSPGTRGLSSRPMYIDLRDRSRAFSQLLAYDYVARIEVNAGTSRVSARCQAVSPNFFSTLGIEPVRGRDFTEADEREGAERVALLGEELSERLTLGVGATFELNSQSFRVVGILPRGYVGLERSAQPELFIPLFDASAYRVEWLAWNRGSAWIRMAGRLQPSVTLQQARADIERIQRALDIEYPQAAESHTFELHSLLPLRIIAEARSRTLLLLGFAVALLFLLAVANFLTLSLLRLFARRREIALRLALGATHSSIVRWVLLELITVVALGFGLGRIVTSGLLAALMRDPETAQLLEESSVHVDARSLGIVAACSLCSAVIVWLFLAHQARLTELTMVIQETSSAPGRRRGFVPLLAVQLALALCLVTLSVAFLGTLREVVSRKLPFRTEQALVLRADVRKLGAFNDRARTNAVYSEALARLASVPGVNAVGAGAVLPLEPDYRSDVPDATNDPTVVHWSWFTFVSAGYFEALGIPILAGRPLAAAEMERAAYAAVVNRSMARALWGGEQQAVGQTFVPWDAGELTTVVGVVEDVPSGWDDPFPWHFYLPFTTTTNPNLSIVAYVAQDSVATRAALAAALTGLWPNPSDRVWWPIEPLIDSTRHDLISAARIASWVALLGMLVVASGLYFSSAFAAAQTLRDSALRMALGASPFDILRERVLRYRWSLLGGLAAGVVLVLFSARILALLQVPLLAPDPRYVVTAALLLTLTALAGLSAPLWRLRRLDILRTLQPN